MFYFCDDGGKKVLSFTCETKEELFSFCHSLIGRWGRYCTCEDLFQKIRCNPNDLYLDKSIFAYEYRQRPIIIMEDDRVFDIRPYKQEIINSPGNIHSRPYKPRQAGHGLDGYSRKLLTGHQYKHLLLEAQREKELARTYGIKAKSVNTNWIWFDDEYCYQWTRDWKKQSKSRKQWGRHKKNPIKRFEKNIYDPELLEPVEELL